MAAEYKGFQKIAVSNDTVCKVNVLLLKDFHGLQTVFISLSPIKPANA